MAHFQDYDYTYISDGKTSKYNRVLIEEDMFFILEGSRGENSVLEELYHAFPTFIRERLMNVEEIEKTLEKACLDLNRVISGKGYACLSGILRVKGEIYSLHVGDCNIVLFSGIVPVYVSRPHSMKNKEERRRIDEKTFIHRNKAEGLYNRTKFFGSYDELYYPLPNVTKVSKRVTHVCLYSSRLKVDLCDIITKVLNKVDRVNKPSTVLLNENMIEGNLCLAIIHI